jgi:hypothetical protein
VHARIRVWDAYGYWPVRSFRASEETAAAYTVLYRSLGGARAGSTITNPTLIPTSPGGVTVTPTAKT